MTANIRIPDMRYTERKGRYRQLRPNEDRNCAACGTHLRGKVYDTGSLAYCSKTERDDFSESLRNDF
jgi:hypothetical protein